METRFPFAQYVSGKDFIGRRTDVTLLGNLLFQGEHVVLYEPPKSGKTSLIQQTLYTMRLRGTGFTVGQFSALNVRTPEDFLLKLGTTLFQMVASTAEDYDRLVKRYLPDTHFVFDPMAFSQRGSVLSLSWELDQADIEALLSLPFRMARDRGDRLILIVDEFQCLNQLEDPDVILRPLDASLRNNRDIKRFSYIFVGSGVNAMKEIFRGSRLFYKVVERVKMSPVDELEIVEYVNRGFLNGGKSVEKELLQGACRLFQGNLWYINHFASLCDAMTRGYIMEPVLVEALKTVISVHEPAFISIMSGLTNHQMSLLRAVLDGVTRFSSADVIRRYKLNSSANVKRVKDALMKKEVLQFDDDDRPSVIDPLLEYWLRKYYFEMKA